MTKLIVFSHQYDITNEAALVNELFKEGMEMFHLKKPLWDEDSQREFLGKINPDFLSKISVHQHLDTVSEFGLKYFHQREKDRVNNSILKQVGITYSTSFHNYYDLKKEGSNWNYCFLSPVFDSISKPGYNSGFAKDLLIEESLNQKVYALGGISLYNMNEAFAKGFYGIAVLGSVWNDAENVITNFKALKAACQKNVHTF